MPFAIGVMSRGCPITPVDATTTSFLLMPVYISVSSHICSAISMPLALHVFAFPLLQIIAFALPFLIFSFVTAIGAPLTRFCVYTAAADASLSLIISAKSFFVVFILIPQ